MPTSPNTPTGPRYLAERYRLDEVLGRGATGTVWAAYDEVLRRRVAVKEVPPPPGMPERDADALRERTLREARAIAMLSHPNVVTLYDVVRQDGEPFVVMELLLARSLAKVISEHGALDVAGAALVGYAMANALQAAHDAGITHRDVKPGNVLIGAGQDNVRIKLTDFGIARNVAESTMTVTGMTLGSPAFIAPEVASGGQVTPAADLWGLGATLFAAVQGSPPYDCGDPLATVGAVVHGEVPRPTAAGALAPVITGLMVKDPARRLSLTEVCRMLLPLLPPDGRVLPDAATVVLPGRGETTVSHAGSHSGTTPVAERPAGASAWLAAGHTAPNGPPTLLASDPGPLPFTAPPSRRRGRGALATTVLVLAATVLFAAGSGGGFVLARWFAGAPPLPQLSAARSSTAGPTGSGAQTGDGALRVREVAVVNDRPGTTDPAVQTRFTIGVPPDWSSYLPPLSTTNTPIAATFVSPEGNRSITVDHLRAFYPRGTVQRYLASLQAALQQSVDEVLPQPVNQVGPATAGATEGPHETSLRTVDRGSGGASSEVLRTTLLYLLPTQTDLWVLRVTAPSDQPKAADLLYSQVVGSFVPGTP